MSWRAAASQDVQDDLDELLTASLELGRHLLGEHGEFHPYGFLVPRGSPRNEIAALQMYPGPGSDDPQALLDEYESTMLARRGGSRAGAVSCNVSLSDGRDAIQVDLIAFDESVAIRVFAPYVLGDDQGGLRDVVLGELEASEWEVPGVHGATRYLLEPAVAGEWGEGTVVDATTHPPVITQLEYEVDCWHGDDLITRFPVYLVSPRLLAAMREAGLTGFAVSPDCRVTVNEQAVEQYEGTYVLEFVRIDVGARQEDDLFVTGDFKLCLSSRAWAVFVALDLAQCDVTLSDDRGVPAGVLEEGGDMREASVTYERGAFQIYDAELSQVLSTVLSVIVDRDVRVLAGEWNGAQFYVESHVSLSDVDAMVYLFDPSTMVWDEFVDQGSFLSAVASGSIAAGADPEGLQDWLGAHDMERLYPGACVPVFPPQFITGDVDRGPCVDEPWLTHDWLIRSARARGEMVLLGLEPGDDLPDDFWSRSEPE